MDRIATVSISVVGVAVGIAALAWARDRYPRFARTVEFLGALSLLAAIALVVITEPLLSALIGGVFVLVNLAQAWAGTSTKWKTEPAQARAAIVWSEQIELMVSLGWDHIDTVVIDLGQIRPAFSSLARPSDETRMNMVGTSAKGGLVSIETLLDEGRGLLVTMRKKSSQLKPKWLFRQELDLPLEELVRAHDEALFLLSTHGIRVSAEVPWDMLDFEFYTSQRYRRDVRQRWPLWAIRPIAVRLSPSRRRRLGEQTDLADQVEGYRNAIAAEPRFSWLDQP